MAIRTKRFIWELLGWVVPYLPFILIGVALLCLLACTGAQVEYTADTVRVINDLTLKSNILEEKLAKVSDTAEQVKQIAGDKSLSLEEWSKIIGGGILLSGAAAGAHNKLRNKTSKDRVRSTILEMKDELKKHLT